MTDTTLLGKKPARKYMQRDRSEKKADAEGPKVRSEKSKRDALYGAELEEDDGTKDGMAVMDGNTLVPSGKTKPMSDKDWSEANDRRMSRTKY